MLKNDIIKWEFEDEEIDNHIEFPIELNKIPIEKYQNFLKELKVGDRFNFTFKEDKYVFHSNGTIVYVGFIFNFVSINLDYYGKRSFTRTDNLKINGKII